MQQSFSSRGQRLFGKGGTPPSLRRRHCNLVSTKQRSKSGIISIIASTNENSKNSSSFSERRKNLNTTNALANDAPTVEDVTSNLAADLDKEGRTKKTNNNKEIATNSNADENKNSYSDTPRITTRRQQ